MKINTFLLVSLFFLNIWIISSDQQIAYTVHNVRSFRPDLVNKYIGCNQKNIVYSTFIYPNGPIDALHIFLNQGTYQTRFNCDNNNRNTYVKAFGTGQNYIQLLQADPNVVAQKLVRSSQFVGRRFIIDWKCYLNKDIQNSRNWLNKFMQAMEKQGVETFLKAPASYFCYINNGMKYLLDLDKPKKFIVQMYGEQAGVYTTYEQIFEKQVQRDLVNKEHYTDQKCSKFPSYKTLITNFAGKQFFIEKTLNKQQAGFIGPRFTKFLEQAKNIYGKVAFLDSFPQQIIQI